MGAAGGVQGRSPACAPVVNFHPKLGRSPRPMKSHHVKSMDPGASHPGSWGSYSIPKFLTWRGSIYSVLNSWGRGRDLFCFKLWEGGYRLILFQYSWPPILFQNSYDRIGTNFGLILWEGSFLFWNSWRSWDGIHFCVSTTETRRVRSQVTLEPVLGVNLIDGLGRVLDVLGGVPSVSELGQLGLLGKTTGERLQTAHRLCVFVFWCFICSDHPAWPVHDRSFSPGGHLLNFVLNLVDPILFQNSYDRIGTNFVLNYGKDQFCFEIHEVHGSPILVWNS